MSRVDIFDFVVGGQELCDFKQRYGPILFNTFLTGTVRLDEKDAPAFNFSLYFLFSGSMRPALLRLLKRPSAISVLDSLISTPIGIEQLETGHKCFRCHTRNAGQKWGGTRVESKPESPADDGNPDPHERPLSFRVHEIALKDTKSTYTEPPCNESGITSLSQSRTGNVELQLERLEFESNIGHTKEIGTKLVDDPAQQQNFALWEELLRYRQRHYGDEGALDVWKGLTVRVNGVQLPVSGKHADFLWESFIKVGLKYETLMEKLEEYSLEIWKTTGKRWHKFHQKVVGGYLERAKVNQAVAWHRKIQHPHMNHPDDILHFLDLAIRISTTQMVSSRAVTTTDGRQVATGVRGFMDICRSTDGHHMYQPVISKLLQAGLSTEAFFMHKLLTERGDHPRDLEDLQPLLDYAVNFAPSKVIRELETYANERFAGSDSQSVAHAAEQTPNTDGKAWIEEKPFKDEFGARLFATNAFNFDVILAGLRMFGVAAIGPQSLRELAVRAHGNHDLLDKIQLLQKSNIKIGDSVFSRLVCKLAAENRSILLSDLLHTDQHPDVLEDASMQESLLVSYYMSRDWRQYQLTLAILAELSTSHGELLNIHFRKHVAAAQLASALKVVDTMALRRQTLTQDSLDFLVQRCLTVRKPGSRPQLRPGPHPTKSAHFVFRILQRVVQSGFSVDANLWTELIKRVGMANRWEYLEEFCLWLARHYHTESKRQDPVPWTIPAHKQHKQLDKSAIVPISHGHRMLQTIFDRQMQCAIVAWCFQKRISGKLETKAYNPFNVHGEKLVPWVRGLVLLRELEQHGVQLSVGWIRRTCRHRLAILFGRPRLSSRPINRLLRRENPYTIFQVIDDMYRAWGDSSLFGGRERHDLERLVNPPSTKMSLRRTRRTVLRATRLRGGAIQESN